MGFGPYRTSVGFPFSKMQKFFLGSNEKLDIQNIDVKGYAKYVLKDGTSDEKRDLLSSVKSKIYLANKEIYLEKTDFKP
jgi:hypothetical protein